MRADRAAMRAEGVTAGKRLACRAAPQNGEAGFALIELLVVMLIIGILATLALPAFLNQRSKANDAKAKMVVNAAETAMEACAIENGGKYSKTNCLIENLQTIEPGLKGAPVPTAEPEGNAYKITVKAETSGDAFSVVRNSEGETTFPCKPKGTGGCPSTGEWSKG